MEKYIIRECPPEWCDFSTYFDSDYYNGGEGFNSTLFIVGLDRYVSDFNGEKWGEVQRQAENIAEGFGDIGGQYATYSTYKECMEDFGVAYNPKKCHDLKEWAKNVDVCETECVARFLSIVTGENWSVKPVRGYCQGDYAEVVFCDKYYTEKDAEALGEVWMGCAKEFCVITLDEDGEEDEAVFGFIVADCEAWTDEEYKQFVCEQGGISADDARIEMISGQNAYREYSYRVA